MELLAWPVMPVVLAVLCMEQVELMDHLTFACLALQDSISSTLHANLLVLMVPTLARQYVLFAILSVLLAATIHRVSLVNLH